MDNIKNDKYYLKKMNYCFERIEIVMKDVTYDMYCSDENIQESTMFNLIQISEYSKKLSEEYKNKHKGIPWSDIYGLRNRIVHDYGNVVLDTVYSTLTEDIPDLDKTIFGGTDKSSDKIREEYDFTNAIKNPYAKNQNKIS